MDSAEHESLGPLSDEARQAEKLLQQLRPRPLSLDRERLMFLAGLEARVERREAGERIRVWLWPAATAGMTAVAASLLIALSLQLARPPVERIVVREVVVPTRAPVIHVVEQPAAAAPIGSPLVSASVVAFPPHSALQMRNMALRFGVDSLPASGSPSLALPEESESLNHWRQLRKAVDSPESSL